MGSRHLPVAAAAVAVAASSAVPPVAGAAPLYWDGSDTTLNADGGPGIWDTTAANWDAAARGGASTTWSNATTDVAVFGGTAGTVTVGTNITVGGLAFNSPGYTISNGPNTLSFGATNNNVLLNSVAAATITGPVGGMGNVSLAASNVATAGTVTLHGTSTGGWSGTTTVNAGVTLALAESNQVLSSTTGITLNGGGITSTNVNATEAGLNRVSNSAPVTSNGGTFTWTNTATSGLTYAETIGPVSLSRGVTNVVLTNNQAGGGAPTNSQVLTLSGVSRSGDATSAVAFISGGGLNTTTNQIVVSGYTPGFMGPWATAGTALNGQNDYATVNSSNQVIGAGIAATAENTWVAGTNVTLSGATTLTGTRTLNTLRYTGAAGTLNLGAADFNLETYGVLNGGSGGMTISTTGTGGLTTLTGGGNLYLTPGSQSLTVTAPINDNGGAVTLVKSGVGTLTLSSLASTYSGGTVINGGVVALSGTANTNLNAVLGGTAGSITFNGGQLTVTSANISAARDVAVGPAGGAIAVNGNNNFTTTGKLTGTGPLRKVLVAGSGPQTLNFTGTANDFTGAVIIDNGNTSGISNTVTFNSLGDAPGAGNIVFHRGASGTATGTFTWNTGATTDLVLSNRRIELAGVSNNTVSNLNTNRAVVVNTDLLVTGAAGARTLVLNAAAGPNNVFAGSISDGADGGASAIALNKTGAGTWTLSGDNSFSGGVTLSGASSGSRLNINSPTALGTGTFVISGGDNARIDNTSGSPLTLSTNNPQTWSNNFAFLGSNSLSLGTGAVSMGGNRTITVTASTLTVGGAIGGAGFGLTKAGAGTLALSGASSYTGATTVNAGTLLVNGSVGGTGVAVNNASRLGGTGSIAAALTVAGTASLAPGTSIESLSSGSLSMGSGTTFLYEAVNAGPTGADLMDVNGALSLANVLLDLTAANLDAGTWALNDKLTLISYEGTPITSGFTGYADDAAYTFGVNSWMINYDDTSAGSNFAGDATGTSFVTLTATAVPEPTSIGLVALAGCGLLARRRRALARQARPERRRDPSRSSEPRSTNRPAF